MSGENLKDNQSNKPFLQMYFLFKILRILTTISYYCTQQQLVIIVHKEYKLEK